MKKSEFTPAENAMIEQEFASLIDAYAHTTHRQHVERIEQAFRFANKAHYGVRRLSGEPYIMHPLAVAKIVVSEIGLGSTSISAALLHDVVEDTDYTVEDIDNLFYFHGAVRNDEIRSFDEAWRTGVEDNAHGA